jgi:capsular polysaccharide biosynthesis protein
MTDTSLPFHRRFYRSVLSRYLVFRAIKATALSLYFWARRIPKAVYWQKHYRIGGQLRLVPASEYRDTNAIKSVVLRAAAEKRVQGPRFVGTYPIKLDALNSVSFEEPKIEISEYRDATAIAGTSFIVRDSLAIHPDYFEPKRDVCHSEKVKAIKIYPQDNLLRHTLDPPMNLEAAISLLGQCAGNYAHFMTEVLPKLLVIDQLDGYKALPILVDAWINPKHIAAIRHFNRHNRKIIEVHIGQPVRCQTLVDVSPTAYTPPEYRSFVERRIVERTPAHVHRFSTFAMDLLRRAARETRPAAGVGRRIFIARKPDAYGNGRNITNIITIENIARREGFDVIEPGALTIAGQIAVFRDAEVIIAPIGGALANTIFTKPGCRIICLSAYYKDADYYYYSNFASALGHDIKFVLGPQIKTPGVHPFHHNYRIDMDAFHEAIQMVSR